MSHLNKLMVIGIRSFGPAEADKAVLDFDTPLTLIAGQNGAGKTTVIECLRFATTGDVPPNARGGAFVCDPRIAGKSIVKGVIRLKFKDTANNSVTCSRMLQSTQKSKKIEQKQLDGSMERVNARTKEKCKLTSRCGELDDEMVSHMGVSKAILNNVIFCHQEDSNWPLSEGKALKTRFDEIFASTRYSKALDSIKKVNLEQKTKMKEYTIEISYLQGSKKKADELKRRRKETQRQLDELKAKMAKIVEELQPKENRIQELDQLYEEFQTNQRKLAELKSSKNELEKLKQGLLEKLQVPLTESEDEIQSMLDRHSNRLERDRKDLAEQEESSHKLSADQDRLKSLHSDQSKEYGRLEVESKQYKDELKRRVRYISTLAEALGISGYDSGSDLSNASIRQILSESVEIIRKKEEDGKQQKIEFEYSEDEIEKEVRELRDNKSRSLQTKEMKKKQLDENTKQIQSITRQLTRVGGASATFDQLDQDVKIAEKDLEEFTSSVDIEALEAELEQLSSQKKTNNSSLSKLQQELTDITKQSSARGALESLQKQKQAKEQEYHKMSEEVENEFVSVSGSMPSSENVLSSIEKFERTKKANLKTAQFKCTSLNRDVATLKTQHEEKTKQLKRKRDELETLETSVRAVCGSTPYPEKKAKVEQDKAKLEEDLATVKGSQTYFKQCLGKARSSKKCPLCARGYETQEALEGLITSIERRLNSKVPELVQTYEQQIKDAEEVHHKLILIKPQMDKIQELMGKEIPQFEREVSSMTVKMENKQTELQEEEKTQSQSQSAIEQVSKLRPKASSVAHLQEDLKKLDITINAELSKLGGNVSQSQRTQSLVTRDLKSSQMMSDELGMKMDNKRREISEAEKCRRELEDKVHSLKKEKLTLQEQVQQRQTLLSKKEELSTTNEGLKRDIDATTRQLKPLENMLNKKEKELENLRRKKAKFEKENRELLASYENMKLNVESSNNCVKKYEARGSETALYDCTKKMEELNQRIEDKNMERKSIEEAIDKLRNQLANAEVRKRELLDNLELHKNQRNIKQKETEITRIKEQMRRQGMEDYDSEYEQLQSEVEKFRKEKARYDGLSQGKKDEVDHLDNDIDSSVYRDIDKRFKDTNVMYETSVVSQRDLEKYYKALDRAIMNFHAIKMEAINKIIKELWVKTYKGGDIDTIKIMSESDYEGGNSGLTARRSYNYKVVMTKGDIELDMRGRCSAGQKVLASIIIRLALAETFSLNCGVIVLDEPTTNLDSENIEGLSQALIDIIKERRRHKHFQLILITHDMKFVELVGRSGVIEEYSLVKKETGCYSTIEKIPINNLAIYN